MFYPFFSLVIASGSLLDINRNGAWRDAKFPYMGAEFLREVGEAVKGVVGIVLGCAAAPGDGNGGCGHGCCSKVSGGMDFMAVELRVGDKWRDC